MQTATSQFLEHFQQAFSKGAFLKCTLSKRAAAAAPDLKNIYLRPVTIKNALKVAFTFRFQTRDEVKNFSLDETLERLGQWAGRDFLNIDLFTTEGDITLSFDKKGAASILLKKPSHTAPPDTGHDRSKQRLLDPAAPWLHALGITNQQGSVLAAAQDKWRQINKYLEIIDHLLKSSPLPADAHIADMGSGKGYLTFALYDFLQNKLSLQPRVTGIELRTNLVDFCNNSAKKAGFAGLSFVAQDINVYAPDRLDMLIALHACDTATDLALAKGIQGKAGIIVVAPCCHKQIRREMETRNELAPVLRYGILEERQAEIITDGIRALLLEANGYKTNVFEFVSTEHTAKNLMITAIGDPDPRLSAQREKALEKVAALKTGFGIREHFLEKQLKM